MEWQDDVGQICGPEHWWVVLRGDGGEEVLPVSDYATPEIILKYLSASPANEDCTVELRYGYGWRLDENEAWAFSVHDDLDYEICSAAKERAEEYRYA